MLQPLGDNVPPPPPPPPPEPLPGLSPRPYAFVIFFGQLYPALHSGLTLPLVCIQFILDLESLSFFNLFLGSS